MATVIQEPPSLLTDPADLLLADVTIRVQLNATDYGKAIARYQTLNEWIERADSPLKDRVELFYPQGSMAIGATIASRLRTDEFDIDIVAQLDLPEAVPPETALDLLFQAIRGAPGSRYHRMTKRRTRCVTVQYRDGMHLDITPVMRRRGTPERESWLFHHRPETPHVPGRRLLANPYGFAEWFKARTPADAAFADVFEARARKYDRSLALAKADSDPVPPQQPPSQKAMAVIALQLLKRWRNVRYDSRSGRRPPSIMFAKMVADAANCTDRLARELLYQGRHMLSILRGFHDEGSLIHIANPICERDVLTDRWPESRQDQAVFLDDLWVFVSNVERLVAGCDLGEMRLIMAELFGEVPTNDVFTAFNSQMGNKVEEGRSRYHPGIGGLVVPTVAGTGIATSTVSRTTPKHTFYGASNVESDIDDVEAT